MIETTGTTISDSVFLSKKLSDTEKKIYRDANNILTFDGLVT